tara:strand:+ start:473 stop:1369 length:897 start_codon:yes stop_codon:yes gene_type:complete
LVRKSKEVSINEIRPIAIIDEFEDTSFILGSKKVSLSNVPYYLESIDGFVPNIEEEIEDTLSNIKVFRTYFSFEKVESQEIRMYDGVENHFIGLWFDKDTNGNFIYLLDCDKDEILQFSNNEDLSLYRKGLVMTERHLKEEYGKHDKEKVRMGFDDVVNDVKRDQLISEDSLLRFSYNLILADGKEVEYFVINCNPFSENVDVVYGIIIKNIKPINLKYSEIKPLINQVDSVESIDKYMEIVVDSVNNDLLLKVTAKKDYERIEKRKSKHTQVVFYINVHTKEVIKVSERKYEVFSAH